MSLSLLFNGQRQIYRSMSTADLVLAAVLAFAGLYAIASLWLPFGWDQAILASVGQAMAEGGLPFRDAWDMKGPMAYVPFAVSDFLFGQVMWGIRLIELLILAPALYFTFRLVEALDTTYVGAWCAVGLFMWIASAGWFQTAQPEIWVAALSVIAFHPFLMPRAAAPGWATVLLAGVLIGIAGLVKPIYLAYGAVPVATAVSASGISFRLAFHHAFWIAVGIALAVLATAAYLWALGGLAEAIDVHIGYTSAAYWDSGNVVDFAKAAANVLTQGTFTVLAPFVALGLWSLRNNVRVLAPMAVWLALGLFFVFLQARFFTYHWFPFYVPYAILAALGVGALLSSTRGSVPGRIAALGACAVFLAQVSVVPAREIYRLGGGVAGLYSTESQYDRYWFMSYVVGDQIRAAQHIEANTRPDDSVFVWGVDAAARYLSGRPNATRFVFNMPLTEKSPYLSAYRQEMMRELAARPPAYIIIGLPWEMDATKASFHAFEAFSEFVAQGYTLEKKIGMLDLYRRNTP
jgi:hypothetical protein